MKTLTALLCLTLAVAALGKDIVVGGREYSVAANLNNQLEWKLSGTTFHFVQDEGKCEIKNDRGKLIREADSDRTPERRGYRMFYSWQTWDLNKMKRLGVGLKMSNAKKG